MKCKNGIKKNLRLFVALALIQLPAIFCHGQVSKDSVKVPLGSIYRASEMFVELDNCTEDRDSLLSQMLNYEKSEFLAQKSIHSLKIELEALQTISLANDAIIANKDRTISKQKKKTLIWQVLSGVLLVLLVTK